MVVQGAVGEIEVVAAGEPQDLAGLSGLLPPPRAVGVAILHRLRSPAAVGQEEDAHRRAGRRELGREPAATQHLVVVVGGEHEGARGPHGLGPAGRQEGSVHWTYPRARKRVSVSGLGAALAAGARRPPGSQRSSAGPLDEGRSPAVSIAATQGAARIRRAPPHAHLAGGERPAVDAGLHGLDAAEVPLQAEALLQRLAAEVEAHPVAGELDPVPFGQEVGIPTGGGPSESDRRLEHARRPESPRRRRAGPAARGRAGGGGSAAVDRCPPPRSRRRARSFRSPGVAGEIVQLDAAQAVQVLRPEIGLEVVGGRIGGPRIEQDQLPAVEHGGGPQRADHHVLGEGGQPRERRPLPERGQEVHPLPGGIDPAAHGADEGRSEVEQPHGAAQARAGGDVAVPAHAGAARGSAPRRG